MTTFDVQHTYKIMTECNDVMRKHKKYPQVLLGDTLEIINSAYLGRQSRSCSLLDWVSDVLIQMYHVSVFDSVTPISLHLLSYLNIRSDILNQYTIN